MSNNKKQLTLISLILMIFTSVFGFTNMPRGFFLMGYAAIPWYIASAILFFIPYAFMMAEYGSAFKNESGGMYSWMEKSVGGKYAFIGTFMWYASYLIWMVNVGSGIWVPLSNAIFGADLTANWSLFGLSATQTLGILGILWIIFVTFVSNKGVDKITKVTSVGGTAVALLNVVLLVGGVLVLILNGGLAQPINNIAESFTVSPSPSYQSMTGVFSFLTFAIFAYGGLEAIGGLVDQTENSEKTFPKGVIVASLIIAIGYALGIFACGIFTNWDSVLNSENVHLGNVAYILMKNFGYELGMAFGTSEAVALSMGSWVARFVGLSMFLALTGAFFTLTYSPLKTLILGAPKEIWPGKLGELNENGMPANAMKVQAIIVIAIIALVAFGGDSAAEFFNILALMTNVAMTVPYMFLSIAFYKFKQKQLNGQIEKGFVIYKSQTMTNIFVVIVTFVVGFANLFTIIQPTIESFANISQTITMIAGPLVFIIAGYVLYTLYEKKYLKNDTYKKAQ